MTDNSELDNFFSSTIQKENANTTTQNTTEEISDTSLEDEFARLLENFVNDSKSMKKEETPVPPSQSKEPTLDSFITSATQPKEDNSTPLQPSSQAQSEEPTLDSFITSATQPKEDNSTPLQSSSQGLDNFVTTQPSSSNMFEAVPPLKTEVLSDAQVSLKPEELELSRAFFNFKDGVLAIANKKNLKTPTTDYEDSQLHPNYKPSIGKKIAQYLLSSWDILNKYDPENMKRLSPTATDEEYLVFAETLEDTDMQLVIISYVEILINLEICEVKYEQMKELASKNRIKKELYEEYIRLQERKVLFIKKIKEQNFPIDADNLINNYFKASQKDSKGAYEALTKNPAMFSPIQMDKIKPKLFGLIKVAPEDGIKFNQKIGSFIKKLKI